MKKFIVFFTLLLCFSMCGCMNAAVPPASNVDTSNVAATQIDFVGGMEFLGRSMGYGFGRDSDEFIYYRDIVTDVLYVCFEEFRKGGFCVMLDPETGLPLTYTRYVELVASPDLFLED